MRYLCIDLGDRRTGLAVGDDTTRIASPVGVLETSIDTRGGIALLDAIERATQEHLGAGDEIVLGLPLNMDGTDGPRAALVRAFAGRIAVRTGRTVHLYDERLSTASADWSMARTGMTHRQKKERRDALAAAAILKEFLAAGAAGSTESPAGEP
ncbi:MAG TPA: Holliday junction resolvase RuvX [Phycisphaerales bacterium]|nr:Holliday junction resolvase RuvX [Phycisphaerales bacterium]